MPNLRRNPNRFLITTTFLVLSLIGYASFGNLPYQAQVAQAAPGINQTLNFQGRLLNSDGTVVANDTYSVVFTLYTVDSGGSGIWTETQSVTTTSGLFRASLGSVNTLSGVNFNQDTLFLGMKVGSDLEMTPRMVFNATPYAFEAKRVSGLAVTNNGGNTLNIGANKTVTFNNSIGFTAADSTTINFTGSGNGVGGLLYASSANTWTYLSRGSDGQCLTSNSTSILWGSCGGGGITADSLDFVDFSDSLTLDASTSIDLGSFNLSSSGTGGMTFAHTGNTIFSGNVGIGNTPASNVAFSSYFGDGYAGLFTRTDATAINGEVLGIRRLDNTVGHVAIMNFHLNNASDALVTYGHLGSVIEDNTTDAESGGLTFATKNAGSTSEKMRITGFGRVGIGDPTPQSKLEISGGENALADVGTSGNYLQILRHWSATNGNSAGLGFSVTNTDNNIGGAIIFKRTGSNTIGELQFYTKQDTTAGADPVIVMTLGDTGIVTIGSGSNTIALNPASAGLLYTGTARPTKTITISPEYPNATFTADGASDTNGELNADNTGSVGNWRNFYEWTSAEATLQEYTIAVLVTLPTDFDAWDTNAFSLSYQTGTASASDNAVSAQITESSQTTAACSLTTDRASTTWTTTNMTCAGATLNDGSNDWDAAGQTAVIRIKVKANNASSAFARIGNISLNYKAKF